MPVNTANFVAQLPIDLVDKVPTVLIVFAIISGIPRRLMVKLPLGYVYLSPSSGGQGVGATGGSRVR
jgi:energy-coupling factor transport system substrate-specific component